MMLGGSNVSVGDSNVGNEVRLLTHTQEEYLEQQLLSMQRRLVSDLWRMRAQHQLLRHWVFHHGGRLYIPMDEDGARLWPRFGESDARALESQQRHRHQLLAAVDSCGSLSNVAAVAAAPVGNLMQYCAVPGGAVDVAELRYVPYVSVPRISLMEPLVMDLQAQQAVLEAVLAAAPAAAAGGALTAASAAADAASSASQRRLHAQLVVRLKLTRLQQAATTSADISSFVASAASLSPSLSTSLLTCMLRQND
jgi:hypothetical protein